MGWEWKALCAPILWAPNKFGFYILKKKVLKFSQMLSVRRKKKHRYISPHCGTFSLVDMNLLDLFPKIWHNICKELKNIDIGSSGRIIYSHCESFSQADINLHPVDLFQTIFDTDGNSNQLRYISCTSNVHFQSVLK